MGHGTLPKLIGDDKYYLIGVRSALKTRALASIEEPEGVERLHNKIGV